MNSIEEITSKFIEIKEKLFNYARWNYYLDNEDTEDLIQDLYLKILKNKDSFDINTNFNAWCFTILKRLFIDKYRSKKKKDTKIDIEVEVIEFLMDSDTNESQSNFLKEDINKAINSLKLESDKLIAELYYQGFKYEEIAKELNRPIGSIKNRLHVVKAHLAKELVMYRS